MVENLLAGAGTLAEALSGSKGGILGRLNALLKHVDPNLVNEAAKLAGVKRQEMNSEARAKHDNHSATLTRIKIDLDKGEEEQILLRSKR